MPASLLLGRRHSGQQRGDHRDGVQQVGQRPKRLIGAGRSRDHIGPVRRHQHPAAIREHKQQLDNASTTSPAQHLQQPTLKRMPEPGDPDLRWKVHEVGSVSRLRSTRSTTLP
jgi:hypothetical protein